MLARRCRTTRCPAMRTAAVAVAGCSMAWALATPMVASPPAGATTTPAFYAPPRPLPHAPAGALIRTEKVTGVPGVPVGATVWRIMYHSRSIYRADVAESGYVIAPAGPAPAGGFPIIAWAHGTTGFAAPCAPSLFTSSGGGNGPYLVPGLAGFLHAGFAIAAADYQGQGVADGIHPYLVGSSEGRAVLDAARATRRIPGLRTRNTVIIYGHSQGGHAALFAGQMAPDYAPDLHLVGVVAAAPATGLSTLISIVASPVGQGYLPESIPVAYSWSRTYRDLPSTDILTPKGERFAASEVSAGCGPALANVITSQHMTPEVAFRSSAVSNPAVLAHAKLNDPGQVRTAPPMLVLQGTADATVPPALTDGFITAKACPIGDTIDYLHVTGATHGTVVFVAAATIVQWMTARLTGKPAPTTCGQPGNLGTLSQ